MKWIALAILGASAVGAPYLLIQNHPKAATGWVTPQPGLLPVREVCRRDRVAYPPNRVFIRVFKHERELELWGANARGGMHLLQTYPIAAASGGPGPKRREGDLQVPEGVYRVARFNPHSRFHLSLGLDYPNEADRILGDRAHLGGDIYIHGNHVSAGCMAMTDPKIDESYSLATHAKGTITVHIFPCRMNSAAYGRLLHEHPELGPFWQELEPIYNGFEKHHVIPRVAVLANGAYKLRS